MSHAARGNGYSGSCIHLYTHCEENQRRSIATLHISRGATKVTGDKKRGGEKGQETENTP